MPPSPDDARDGLADRLADRLARYGQRKLRPLARMLAMRQLAQRNLHSRESLLQAAGPVVSLTTFEPRWPRVHVTLESIGAGHLLPSRLLLWVAPSVLQQGTPVELQRLVARGLEIHTCEDTGPHKKYFPAVNLLPAERNLVTADDDVIYPADWLQSLADASARRPEAIHAHRARAMRFLPDGRLAPYADWPDAGSTEASLLHMSVGIGGVLYPPAMQQALRAAGDGFKACCPRADDVWLKVVGLRAGLPVAQVRPHGLLTLDVPGMRASGLAKGNVKGGGNDRQIEATFTADDLARLRTHR